MSRHDSEIDNKAYAGSGEFDGKEPVVTVGETNILKHSERRPFETSSLNSFYKPIDSYEGAHRYDPDFEWTPAEEARVVRRIDYKICAWVCFMFFALQLDRGNISQALTDNFLDDLHMTTDDYNNGQSIFYACFLLAELPSQLVSKKIGPDNWIPIQMVSWSLVASMQAFLSGKASFFVCRALLGMIEGGFIPDNILYLSYFYTSSELPRRLSWFWTSYQTTSIVSAFLAYGILHMSGVNGMAGWRWLFALEGTLTGIIGIISYFYLPPSPCQTKSKFRGQEGWFNEREEKIMVNRVLRDDPSKGDMHNRQALSWSMLREALSDYHMWPIFLIAMTWNLPTVPINSYLTLIIKDAGFSTFETNLLSIPAYCLFIINLLWVTWVSEKINERFLLALISQFWILPCLIALEVLPNSRSHWVTYALCILVFAQPYVHAILVSITSRNAGSVRTRTVGSALYNMGVQTASITGAQIYRTSDKPYYHTGNKALIAIVCYNIVLFVATKIFYVRVNAKREKTWTAMSKEEKEQYLATTKDKGNKRLDFRFAH